MSGHGPLLVIANRPAQVDWIGAVVLVENSR
jgi:hypothetical protein